MDNLTIIDNSFLVNNQANNLGEPPIMALSDVQLFPGLTKAVDGTTITIPVAALPGMSAAEVTAGDGRKLAYALMEGMAAQLVTAPEPPTQFTLTAGDPITSGPDTVSKTYVGTFTLAYTVNDVAPEPA